MPLGEGEQILIGDHVVLQCDRRPGILPQPVQVVLAQTANLHALKTPTHASVSAAAEGEMWERDQVYQWSFDVQGTTLHSFVEVDHSAAGVVRDRA